MAAEVPDGSPGELEPRAPQQQDLVRLCAELNRLGARYVVCGGFAIIHAGYPRTTGDIDLLVDTSPENEARVFQALESLPDKAVRELQPGDIAKYTVVRVADEILVDLMGSASGVQYGEAVPQVISRTVDGVSIPFASPRLLWQMKSRTFRAKDESDLVFLRQLLESQGERAG